MNPLLETLEPYPFSKLKELLAGTQANDLVNNIPLSVGEPRHEPPSFVLREIEAALPRIANYPSTQGLPELRQTIASWLERRYALTSIDADTQVLPVNGTREALFAFAQAVVAPSDDALVLCPNPFYQIYEGATKLAGATPLFLNCTADTGFLPDFDRVTAEQWQHCQLLYLCSPGNPTGAVMPLKDLQKLIALAREFDFILASDECYSEIYRDEQCPPTGLLEACDAHSPGDYSQCVVFHSLSKRSNLPGLRSGFVAGDERLMEQFLRYRTYHGCAMPIHHQLGSICAWNDEDHVIANRVLYREKFTAVADILKSYLPLEIPDAGFYLWPETPCGDADFARLLFEQHNVTVLPGSYLARQANQLNPGENRVRMALVATLDDCVEAAQRIVKFLEHNRGFSATGGNSGAKS